MSLNYTHQISHIKSSLHSRTLASIFSTTRTEQKCQLKSKSVTLRLTVGQSVSIVVEPHTGLLFDSHGLVLWGALSDERTGLSFVYAAGPCQSSLSRVRVPYDSRPYFAVSKLRLPFSSPLATLRVTVEVFEPASTRIVFVTECRRMLTHDLLPVRFIQD
jgi:hypothetical protein